MEQKFVAYYRCSRKEQESSGLGLLAQRQVVEGYIKNNGNRIVDEFTEIESGRRNDRPELLKAISLAKQENAVLIIAKLDRLSRSLTLISTLMDSKVKFTCANLPQADESMIGFMAVMAQHEVNLIRERTKQALDAKTAKDPDWWVRTHKHVKNLTDEGRKKAHATVRRNADMNKQSRHAFHFIKPLREQGLSLRKIADMLNAEAYTTRTGRKFNATTVKFIYERFSKKD